MKKFILPAIMVFAGMLASCSKYQISMLSSTNSVKDEKTGVFNFENDSVKISYAFYGPEAPVNIQVLNKLDKPLYIDWQRSAAVIGNQAVSYVSNQVNINGAIHATTFTAPNQPQTLLGPITETQASLKAVAELPKSITFLPPHAQISNVPLTLKTGMLALPESAYRNEKMDYFYAPGQKQVNAKVASFDKASSPFVFKSFLTLYLQNGSEVKPLTYQHEFFVSQVVTTAVDPQVINGFQVQRGDYFFTSDAAGYGKTQSLPGDVPVSRSTTQGKD
jgi:hypothetical protein